MSRRSAALLAALAAGCLVLSSCGADDQAFCDELERQADLGDLVSALTADQPDPAEVEAALDDLAALEEKAPEELSDDVHAVLVALEDLVRIVSGVGEDGGSVPTEDEVEAGLRDTIAPAQAIEEWSTEHC